MEFEDILGIIMEYVDMFNIPNVLERSDIDKLLFNKYQMDVECKIENDIKKSIEMFYNLLKDPRISLFGGEMCYYEIHIPLYSVTYAQIISTRVCEYINKLNSKFIARYEINYTIIVKIIICTEEEYKNFNNDLQKIKYP